MGQRRASAASPAPLKSNKTLGALKPWCPDPAQAVLELETIDKMASPPGKQKD
jgi:hypothetical protein